MSMKTHDGEVVLSCPACWSWQLHFDPDELARDGVFPSLEALEAFVEQLLREHVANECTHPRLFHQLAKARGVV